MPDKLINELESNLKTHNVHIENMNPLETIEWAYKNFKNKFAFTTSFGIQSSVLLSMIEKSTFKNKVKIFFSGIGIFHAEKYKVK